MTTSSSARLLAAALIIVSCTSAPVEDPAPSPSPDTPTTTPEDPDPTPVSARLADAGLPRLEVAAAAIGDRVYVAGGFERGGVSRAVEIYDVATDTWSRGPDLPIPLHHAMGVAYGGRFAVFGGFMTSGFSIASDRGFMLVGDAWAELPALPRARAAGGAVFVSGVVVLVGGQDGQRLVPETDLLEGTYPDLRWRRGASIPTPRDHLAATGSADHVYVIGGRLRTIDSTMAVVERYDVAEDAWEELPSMPTARGGFAAAFLAEPTERIVAIGGEGSTADAGPDGVFDAIEVYDVEEGAWSALPSDLLTARHGHGVVAIGRTVYVIVGGRERGLAFSRILESLTFPA